MLDQLFTRGCVLRRLQSGLFGPWLRQLADTLHQQGYALGTIRNYLYASDKFGQWLGQQGCSVADANARWLGRYTGELRCSPTGRLPKAAVGLNHLFTLLQQQGVVAGDNEAPSSEAEQWLMRYDAYLERVVGSSRGTRARYRTIVRRFLTACFGTNTVCWKTLTADDISAFILQEVRVGKRLSGNVAGVAVRSLLGFLVFSGELQPGLEAAVPAIRQWQQARLPRRFTAEQVVQLLASCDTATPVDWRDRAMLLLLARLGLRACEVAQLRLEDIDWRGAQLWIRPGKTHRERVLPLSQEIGDALVAYLSDGRPNSTSRIVFLNSRAPYAPFAGSAGVSWVVRRAARRAGFPQPLQVGAHMLRHSAATQMVCQGASFKAVADVLGHRSLQSTGHYAKLDLAALEQVALPWPGGEQ